MNALTRFDTNALNRALVGFDRIFNDMETRFANQINSNYPPYNIVKINDNLYNVVLAVAGFGKDEVSVSVDQDQLIVVGKHSDDTEETNYLHRGLAFREFERRFTLAEHMEVIRAEMKDGLLTVQIERKIPESMKPKTIAIEYTA
jgi:molecular chaperone IbpA